MNYGGKRSRGQLLRAAAVGLVGCVSRSACTCRHCSSSFAVQHWPIVLSFLCVLVTAAESLPGDLSPPVFKGWSWFNATRHLWSGMTHSGSVNSFKEKTFFRHKSCQVTAEQVELWQLFWEAGLLQSWDRERLCLGVCPIRAEMLAFACACGYALHSGRNQQNCPFSECGDLLSLGNVKPDVAAQS